MRLQSLMPLMPTSCSRKKLKRELINRLRFENRGAPTYGFTIGANCPEGKLWNRTQTWGLWRPYFMFCCSVTSPTRTNDSAGYLHRITDYWKRKSSDEMSRSQNGEVLVTSWDSVVQQPTCRCGCYTLLLATPIDCCLALAELLLAKGPHQCRQAYQPLAIPLQDCSAMVRLHSPEVVVLGWALWLDTAQTAPAPLNQDAEEAAHVLHVACWSPRLALLCRLYFP